MGTSLLRLLLLRKRFPFGHRSKFWLLDVSNGIEQVSEWSGDQVDDGYECGGVAVASGPCPGRFEDAVEAL